MSGVPADVAAALKGDARYDESSIAVLEKDVRKQVADSVFRLEGEGRLLVLPLSFHGCSHGSLAANLSLLKLYQFFPQRLNKVTLFFSFLQPPLPPPRCSPTLMAGGGREIVGCLVEGRQML